MRALPIVTGAGRAARLVVYSLLPTILLLGVAEIGFRLFPGAAGKYYALPMGPEYFGLLRADADLLFSLRPNVAVVQGGTLVRTNSLGLRSPEVGEKEPGEFRVLSLGESTTMGSGVLQEETYSARLEGLLRRRLPGRPWTVVNAGVTSYSSYQSLLYLSLRGLQLQPDLVLFYHELNDYMPSTYRHTENATLGMGRTDKEHHTLSGVRLHRVLHRGSALYRRLLAAAVQQRIGHVRAAIADDPLPDIGLHRIGLPTILRSRGQGPGPDREAVADEFAFGTRVTPRERRWVFEKLTQLCRSRGILLVIIHPAYAESRPHECLLTRYCRETGTPMLEAYPLLHPEGAGAPRFVDAWHPSAEGHDLLAGALADLLPRLPGFPLVPLHDWAGGPGNLAFPPVVP